MLQDFIIQGSVHRVKMTLLFYSCLAQLNYLSLASYNELVNSLIKLALNEDSEFFLYIVAYTIAFTGGLLNQSTMDNF
jgi:hypothetical protein